MILEDILYYIYGGMYIDIDMFILRSIDNLNILEKLNSNFLGLSCLNINTIESMFFCGKKKIINNAIMISNKNNYILKKLIIEIIDNYKKNKYRNTNDYSKIQKLTGPKFLNKFIYKNKFEKNIHLYPHYIFEPAPPFGLADIRESTIAIHLMELSWIQGNLKKLIKFYYCIKSMQFRKIF